MMAGPAAAATVMVDFNIEITSGTAPTGGSAVGETFMGTLTYDDTGVIPGTAFTRTPADGNLMLVFPFLDRTLTENDSDVPGNEPEASFAPDGSLTGLTFSTDVPNEFFIFVGGLAFSYDYSEIRENEFGDFEQVTIARGSGVLSQPMPIPLPAAAPLMATVLLFGGLLARRRASA